ncbi:MULTISPECIES: sigma-54 dependent transcriptional regulator [unclassified Oceanispirochaeta]|uniref:sigma-54-dependent transcriptional regulator n=1 Tax=unclassified Oceanispirochaeta TaxID=2635722 RepID=UPI000E095348|nr:MULTISPECIES: sigma-54 dependent transcriptional regulator [unclassified Oceanispirochaeta]MBF9014198.1 sigma-54-dependent Fis family transcriptional regulator [Oceanispirochaeta sp. M2]NPD70688.1 sigma-54-dependent Fis family transcriptional regulator [Oceanispirochaeta sp. M1]RDG34448.1 sigma-54-dependent Fis family transcriptional regulator [Oceanispirochaeta sp. M1]
MIAKILIVDDEAQLCISLSKLLKARGYSPIFTTESEKVMGILKVEKVSLVITDLKMPGMSGIDLIRLIRTEYSELPIIMVSGYASVDNVVKAMRYGAVNFFEKPVRFSEMAVEIDRLLPKTVMKSSLKNQKWQNSRYDGSDSSILTFNPSMQEKINLLKKAAPTDAPVLITGESGTGKELAASMIHAECSRFDKPFIKLNCAAIPETLLESELFGHEKGAFTDAVEARSGKFEVVGEGTLFLDEIGEISLKTQAKLLRVLQEKEFERIGSHKTRRMEGRIVAATNRKLKDRIREGLFREDLFYRLSVIQIELPALRSRKEDILPLTRLFLSDFNQKYGKNISGFDQETEVLFLKHDWPGNIRELKNTIERMVIFCDEEIISTEFLPEQYKNYSATDKTVFLKTASNSISRDIILDALDKTGGNRSRAADYLGITRRTLYNKMKKLDIEV